MPLPKILRWLKSNNLIILLFLIVAVGSALRFYDLGTESLWLDEATSVRTSALDVNSLVIERAGAGHVPLYFIILHFWVNLTGTSEAAVRSLSAIFGILTILITCLAGKELFNYRVGLIASLLSSISYFHIYFSQEARPYALLLVLSVLSYLFFIKILKYDRNWYYVSYFVVNFLLGYTHFYSIFIITSQIFYFCLFWNRYRVQRWRFIETLAGIALSLIPALFLLGLTYLKLTVRGFWITRPSSSTLFDTFAIYAGYGWGRDILLWLFSLLALLSLRLVKRTEGKWILRKPLGSLKSMSWSIGFESVDEVLLLIVWLLFPVLIPFLVSQVTTPFYFFKYAIGASPAFYLLVARGISIFNAKKWLSLILPLIITLSGLGLHSYYVNDVKEQWREVTKLVETESREGDVIVICANFCQKPFDYYYKGDLPRLGIRREADTNVVAKSIDDAVSGKDRLWLILSHGCDKTPLQEYLMKRYGEMIILEEKFIEVHVILFEIQQDKIK